MISTETKKGGRLAMTVGVTMSMILSGRIPTLWGSKTKLCGFVPELPNTTYGWTYVLRSETPATW